jgi:holo-[acyl-carrier protein] synthase
MNNPYLFSEIPHKEMSILGIGSDICNITRIDAVYKKFNHKFLTRIFSSAECTHFETLPSAQKIPFLAKRFALKEAVSKSLHTGIGKHAYFTEISCLSHKNQPPTVNLLGKTHNTALLLAQKNKYARYKICASLSDDTDYALAFIILIGTH